METEQRIGIAQYYSAKVKEESEADKIFNEKHKYNVDESTKQRSACWSALLTYLDNRGYKGIDIHNIFKANSRSSSSGFENIIYFLETKFDEIEIAKTKTALSDDQLHLNMQYYMEFCERHGYVTPKDWIEKHKHFK